MLILRNGGIVMYKITKGKLEIEGIEFVLPENFFIDASGVDGINPDGLRLLSPEFDVCIGLSTTELDFSSSMESLLDVFTDCNGISHINMYENNETGYIWLSRPENKKINSLKCACVKYETTNSFYYEIHFDRINGFKKQLEVIFEVKKEIAVGLDDILNRCNIKDFYLSFKKA